MTAPVPSVDVHLAAEDLIAALLADVSAGLGRRPRRLPPKWLYDERGCDLFDQITRLPEYYLTRREREILEREAATVARLAGADTLVEIGSGTSEKTRLLLDAMAAAGQLRRIVLLDVSEPTIRCAADQLAATYRGVEVHGVVGDFERHLRHLPGDGRRLVAFLGSTIGNLEPPERARFLGEVSGLLRPGEGLLLGTDLVKDAARLEAAYDDARGVTAAFNRNVLSVLNRRVGADFDLEAFDHMARFDPEREWVEMRLRSAADQEVKVAALDMTVPFERGEDLRTEISAKFRREVVEAEVAGAGLSLERWWTDPASDFAVSLSLAT